MSIVDDFIFQDEKTVCFHIHSLPATEQVWNVFAAELHFYKKGVPFSLVLHGVAVISDAGINLVQFSIQNAVYFMPEDRSETHFLSNLFKPYIEFYHKGSELLSFAFNKKTLVSALHKFSINSDN